MFALLLYFMNIFNVKKNYLQNIVRSTEYLYTGVANKYCIII